jgi:hypothetical protein
MTLPAPVAMWPCHQQKALQPPMADWFAAPKRHGQLPFSWQCHSGHPLGDQRVGPPREKVPPGIRFRRPERGLERTPPPASRGLRPLGPPLGTRAQCLRDHRCMADLSRGLRSRPHIANHPEVGRETRSEFPCLAPERMAKNQAPEPAILGIVSGAPCWRTVGGGGWYWPLWPSGHLTRIFRPKLRVRGGLRRRSEMAKCPRLGHLTPPTPRRHATPETVPDPPSPAAGESPRGATGPGQRARYSSSAPASISTAA